MATVTLRPNANGGTIQWPTQNPGTGSHYDKVNEESADSDTTYVYNGGGAECIDLFDLPVSGMDGGATISNVKIYARARGSDVTNPGSIWLGFNDGGGAWWSSTEKTLTDGVYATYDTGDLATNPRTSAAWTPTQIDALQIGVKGKNGGYEVLTQVYVEVTYTPGEGVITWQMI